MTLNSDFLLLAHDLSSLADNTSNFDYPFDSRCNATFKADPDIAGPGVIAAFLATSWITCVVAAISAYYDLRERHKVYQARRKEPLVLDIELEMYGPKNPKAVNHKPQPRLKRAARKLLVNLSDLQVITGSSVIIAGLAQLPEISYYHEFLVNEYWYLCLNSFWAAKTSYRDDDDDEEEDWWPSVARRLAILLSVILALIFQIKTNLREQNDWDNGDWGENGKCYISNDTSGSTQNWVWIGGLFAYAIFLLLSLNKKTLAWFEPRGAFTNIVNNSVAWLSERYEKAVGHLLDFFKSPSVHSIFCIIWVADWLLQTICRILWFLLIQWMCVWAWGTGRCGIQAAVFAAFTMWNSYDVIDLKRSNWFLVDGTESVWAFGQVLPVALMAMLLVNAMDAFKDDRCKHCGKCR